VGNHDIPSTSLKASSIEIYDTLRVPNVWVADKYEGKVVETARGPVYVAAAPFPVRQRLLDSSVTSRSIRDADDKMALTMGHLLDELATDADTQGDIPRLLTGHFTVGGAVVGSERAMMMGRDLDVNLGDLADDRWDYVALGHIHKHQNLTKARTDVPPVVYSGSIERVDFGEEADPKGVCFIELSRGGTTWEFVRLDARPFSTLRIDVRKSDDPTQDAIELVERSNLKDSVARLFVQMRQEQSELFNESRVREALRGASVFHIAVIRKDIESPQRSRLGISPEGLTPTQLLERYLISADVPTARREALLAEALSLMSGE
jgi:exonuclease SbcD